MSQPLAKDLGAEGEGSAMAYTTEKGSAHTMAAGSAAGSAGTTIDTADKSAATDVMTPQKQASLEKFWGPGEASKSPHGDKKMTNKEKVQKRALEMSEEVMIEKMRRT